MKRQAAVNVDIDSLALYYRIHGLDASRATDVVWTRGVPRFMALFDELGIRATFFCVAADIETNPDAREQAKALVAEGHELASHSWSHPYDLTRKTTSVIAHEVRRSREILSEVRGQPVVGFRAPGYTMNEQVFSELEAAGYTYDSSIFPCPPYYLAKAAVLASMALRGKHSESILDKPSVMWAKTQPHQRGALQEFPVTVLPWLRAPFIGTSLLMMGDRGYSLIRPWLKRAPFVNLEFHGIDMCDMDADGIDPALLKQPDLRVPLRTKEALFRRVLGDLRDDWGVETLEALSLDGVPR
ncbi:MAG: polysaccharide deacetylase family protein [Myxococcota bacterium]